MEEKLGTVLTGSSVVALCYLVSRPAIRHHQLPPHAYLATPSATCGAARPRSLKLQPSSVDLARQKRGQSRLRMELFNLQSSLFRIQYSTMDSQGGGLWCCSLQVAPGRSLRARPSMDSATDSLICLVGCGFLCFATRTDRSCASASVRPFVPPAGSGRGYCTDRAACVEAATRDGTHAASVFHNGSLHPAFCVLHPPAAECRETVAPNPIAAWHHVQCSFDHQVQGPLGLPAHCPLPIPNARRPPPRLPPAAPAA